MRRLGVPVKVVDFEKQNPGVNDWLYTIWERLHVYSGASDPTLAEIPENQWIIYYNTTTGVVSVWTRVGSAAVDITSIPTATELVKGIVELATSAETTAGLAVQASDTRLSDNRDPNPHAADHRSGGGDSIKLDDLAAPDDNTDLNATAAAHGLLPKLSGSATDVLLGDGTWDSPPVVLDTAYTVGTLPAAASNQYVRAFVTDANATTFHSVVAGGGANIVPVWSDGTDWRIG